MSKIKPREIALIQRKAFKKWLFISALCGAHSFFWGVVAQGSPIAMLAGVITLALMFAAIESHPSYQARRVAAPRLARALDGGVKFRCWLAVYVVVTVLLSGALMRGSAAPYMGELFIGMGSISLTRLLTGINLEATRPHHALPPFDNFIATYLTTIFTGLAHTVILGVICLLAYGVVRLRSRGKAALIGEGIAKE
jgi:heme/copper-type cytochrome/quinol oxidase subunit 2